MRHNQEPEETVPTVLDEVKILRRADRRHHQRLDRIGRRLAKRDNRIAGMDRKIQQLETALATRTLDIESLSRKLRREAQDAEAGLEAIRAKRAENRKIRLWANRLCTQRLLAKGKEYPRTCQFCGLGPCPYPAPES